MPVRLILPTFCDGFIPPAIPHASSSSAAELFVLAEAGDVSSPSPVVRSSPFSIAHNGALLCSIPICVQCVRICVARASTVV